MSKGMERMERTGKRWREKTMQGKRSQQIYNPSCSSVLNTSSLIKCTTAQNTLFCVSVVKVSEFFTPLSSFVASKESYAGKKN